MEKIVLNPSQIAKARELKKRGYSIAQIFRIQIRYLGFELPLYGLYFDGQLLECYDWYDYADKERDRLYRAL